MPSFRYIPVLGDPALCDLQITELDGITTHHGNTGMPADSLQWTTDGGTVYVSVHASDGAYTVSIFGDRAQYQLACSGSGQLLTPIILTAANTSGITGVAYLASYTADNADIVAVPSFATDIDVLVSFGACQSFAGAAYDTTYGLAEFHAQAMREIVGSALPAVVPHLYGKEGLAPFVPGQQGTPDIPDLRRMANVGQLRQAQGALVKALVAEQQEHLEEMALIARGARERYETILEAVHRANIEESEEAKQEVSNVSVGFGQMRRA